MEASGNNATTVQIYLRNLKAIINRAIKAGYIPERLYPFKNYIIGTSCKSKNVLYPHQVKTFGNMNHKASVKKSKSIFLLLLLCNGMNFKNVAYLRYRDMKGDCFRFVREKTKRIITTEKRITVYLHPEARKVIDVLGNQSTEPNDYVSPF